ncbi:gamma-glutamyltransferase [Nocardioides houyundeii]|uniref:gamma-glutamyltransferase n=1 Tax=Nocardioides houyundeii TaxID=2045452 RepID=UPI000DF15D00|nr:gamma-glutamyltransferase [Nocardioides houyundeii]
MKHRPSTRRTAAATLSLGLCTAVCTVLAAPAPAAPAPAPAAQGPRTDTKVPTAVGRGGAVSTVDPEATRAGLQVLKDGGNAVDAAVAAAATLGVTEPYSAGIGGGGYFVLYDAKSGKVRTIDGRETAPAKMRRDAFIDPATGKPWNFAPELVTSGVSVGVPGTLATWDKALRKWGRWSLGEALAPATKVAQRGFIVDETFHNQTTENAVRFAATKASRRLWLPGGSAPRVGSVFRNPDLAATYRQIARDGVSAFYQGKMAGEIVRAVRDPDKTRSTELPVPAGRMTRKDLKGYQVALQRPTRVDYRGYDVYGMAPSSSGGSTVGEALNILERYDLRSMSVTDALHHYLEASSLAFADRGKYVGDPAYVDVPLSDLLSDTFAAERACAIKPGVALPKPTAAGNTASYDGSCSTPAARGEADADTENLSTTNLTVVDRWGNVVEYTLTIEQTGGSGITVPGRGFLLNNELTDFSVVYDASDPNRIQPGKRPRSSMSPTIVLKDGRPFLALGSPGGSTIITTVLQTLVNRIDLGMSIEQALAAPRVSPRNGAETVAEPAFVTAYGAALSGYGHKLVAAAPPSYPQSEIGAATAIELSGTRRLTAVSEPTRRGGGAAGVVTPRR